MKRDDKLCEMFKCENRWHLKAGGFVCGRICGELICSDDHEKNKCHKCEAMLNIPDDCGYRLEMVVI